MSVFSSLCKNIFNFLSLPPLVCAVFRVKFPLLLTELASSSSSKSSKAFASLCFNWKIVVILFKILGYVLLLNCDNNLFCYLLISALLVFKLFLFLESVLSTVVYVNAGGTLKQAHSWPFH